MSTWRINKDDEPPDNMNRFRILVMMGRVLLGVFVLGQVAFLLVSLVFNLETALGAFINLPWLRAWREHELNGVRQYGQLTAQRQNWQLFAPDVATEFAFLEIELRWDDWDLEPGSVVVHDLDPVQLHGKAEPDNLNAFVRTGSFRIRKYETWITPDAVGFGDVRFGNDAAQENAYNATFFYGERAEKMLAYLRWRLADYRRAHPERPAPTQVLLWLHRYRIPKPPGSYSWSWEDRGFECVGRWLPEPGDEAGKDR
jgi:hypothetical protein